MNNIGWKRLRILVTNKCNYRCSFCHNEGQSKTQSSDMMSYEDFKKLIDCLKDQDIEELHFSGGEPFLNHDLTKMILYACKETTWDIGCASNLSLINDEQINEFLELIQKVRNLYDKTLLEVKRCGTFGKGNSKIPNNFMCPAGTNLVAITPDMSVYPCNFLAKPGYEIGKVENGIIYITKTICQKV